jgi:MFS family permease
MMLVGMVAYLICIALAASGVSFHHYLGALILLGIGWNFLFVGGTSLLPQGYNDSERFRVQGLNDMMVFGFQAVASMSAGLALSSLGWAGLLLLAIPLLLLHSGLMLFWYLRSNATVTQPH